MANFIIQILRSKIAFASDSFFESTLNWNLTQNTKSEVDFVSAYSGKKNEDGDTRDTLKLISDDEDVMFWCDEHGVLYETPRPSHKVNLAFAFWDGPRYDSLPTEMVDPDSPKIDKSIKGILEANEGCRVIHRYPTITFRVKGKLQALHSKGITPTLDLAMGHYREENTKATELRNMITWGDQPKPIDPDTGVEYPQEEIDQNINLYNAYQFNADLWKAVYKHLKTSK
tara:strand:+ start:60 stop:743 length:684 start_codon:yes stop_codon:yes gene_type:complete